MGHIEAFKLARHENLLGGRGGEEVEEMATFDLENEQESGIPTMDESWVLVGDIDTARWTELMDMLTFWMCCFESSFTDMTFREFSFRFYMCNPVVVSQVVLPIALADGDHNEECFWAWSFREMQT